MKNLYLRIYGTVVVVLLLFAATSGWLFQRHIDQQRARADAVLTERMSAWAELIQHSLPSRDQPAEEQAAALREWSMRLRLPLALDGEGGWRIAQSDSFVQRQAEGPVRSLAVRLQDGRTLWIMRPGSRHENPRHLDLQETVPHPHPHLQNALDEEPPFLPFMPPAWQKGIGFLALLGSLFIAVATGAFPVVKRLTRRLELLKLGVETFGSGQLHHRVEVSGRDEVAAVAASFNTAAERVEALVRSHQSLLANASHELRSPLARMKMAVSMLGEAGPAQRAELKTEIDTNVAELDALVEEVLLASRLDAKPDREQDEKVELLGLAAEEAARVDATVDGTSASVIGEERLLRRAMRNLLENARRYGGGTIEISVQQRHRTAEVHVCDRGPGVPEHLRDRIFESFFRLPGHAEQAGGVGLGLSLVKQIAERHGGQVRCEGREGGGSCFVLSFPAA